MSAPLIKRKLFTLGRMIRSRSLRWEWDALHSQNESARYQTLEQLPRYWMLRGMAEWVGSNLDVLEIGCGAALLPAMFRPDQCASYTGVDVSPVALEQAKTRYPGGRYIEGKAEELTFDENQFDLLIFNETIYYMKDFSQAFVGLMASLRAGGHVLLSITHLERDTINIFEQRFDSLIRMRHVLADPTSEKKWTLYLVARPDTISAS